MTSTSTRTRRLLAVVVATAGCAGLTACGSSHKPSGGASAARNQGIAFANCMRTHGVPNFPDPGSGGGIQLPQGANPFSPSFRAAQGQCHNLLPFGGPGRGKPSAQRKAQLVHLAQCMRAHGISSFPDPTNAPPSAPPSGGGVAFGGPGGFISIPQSVMNSPGFQEAARVCQFPGGGGPRPGGDITKSITAK